MPTVPVIDQTAMGAQPFASPDTARFRNSAPEQMVQTGQAIQQTGSVALRTGQTMGNALADQVDEARIRQGESSFLTKANDLLYGENGYLNTRGQAAINGADSVKQAVAKAGNDVVADTSNPIQEHALRQLVTQHLVTLGRTISLHNVDQTRQYAIEAAAGSLKRFGNVFKSDKSIGRTRNIDLVHTARAILTGVGIGKTENVGRSPESYLANMQAYSPELYNELAPVVESALQEAKSSYRNMTVASFDHLKTAVEALWRKSREGIQVEIDGTMFYRDNVLHDLKARMDVIGVRANQPGVSQAVTGRDRLVRSIDSTIAASRRVEHWADAKDGDSPEKPFTRSIVRSVLNAATEYRLAKEEPMRQLHEIIAGFDVRRQKIEAPELGYTFVAGNGGYGKYEVLGALMHSGNESNMRKLLLGRGWGLAGQVGELDMSRFDAFVQRMYREGTLTKADMDGVQKVWDLTESLKPKAQDTYRRIFGYNFKEIEYAPIESPAGTYRGGYVPAKADPFTVRDVQRNAKMEELETDFRNAMPSTGMGFTRSRVEDYTKPLSLDLRLIAGHIDDTMRFSYMQPAIKDVLGLLRDREFADKLYAQDPAAMEGMLLPWLNRAARQITGERGSLPWVDALAKRIRGSVGMATMFGNLANTLIHVSNVSSTLLKVEPRHAVSALFEYMRAPRETTAAILEKSDFMKTRLDLQSREMQRLSATCLRARGR